MQLKCYHADKSILSHYIKYHHQLMKIERIPIQVFNFFPPLSHWLKYLPCLFWITVCIHLASWGSEDVFWFVFIFFFSLLDLRAISEFLDSSHFSVKIESIYRGSVGNNIHDSRTGIKTFGGLNSERLYCPLQNIKDLGYGELRCSI